MPDSLHTFSAAADSLTAAPCPTDTLTAAASLPTASFFDLIRQDCAAASKADTTVCLRLEDIRMPAGGGIPGTPLSYMPAADDGFGLALLLIVFLTVGAAMRSWHGLCAATGNLFRPTGNADSRDTAGTSEIHGRFFFVLQAAFMLGLLYFDRSGEYMAAAADDLSPRYLLAADVAVCLAACYLQLAACRIVNAVFFSRTQALLWAEACHLALFAVGFLLLPVALLTVYDGLSPQLRDTITLFVLSTIGILLFFRAFRIFFKHGLGYLHLILYFCTLEIVPAFMLWRFLSRTNLILTTNL